MGLALSARNFAAAPGGSSASNPMRRAIPASQQARPARACTNARPSRRTVTRTTLWRALACGRTQASRIISSPRSSCHCSGISPQSR